MSMSSGSVPVIFAALLRDATASSSDDHVHAALDVNIPN